MSRLQELGKDRLEVLKRLISSQELCKALKYDNPDFLGYPDIEDPSELINTKIFPYNRVPGLDELTSSFVTFSFRDYRPVKNKFKSGLIHFQVLVHNKLISTDYEMLRYDYILSCIDDLFNETDIGIGKLQFSKLDEFYVNTEYVGMYIQYKLWEFN